MRPFLMYVAARASCEGLERLYRVYVTESLFLQPQGKYIAARFQELIEPPDDFKAEAIVDEVIERAGLEVIE